jgi:hypothetical protein
MNLASAIGVNSITIDEIVSGEKPFMKAHLSPSEREWLSNIQGQCQKAIEYAKFNIGYVSGNKKYFHPSDKVIVEFQLPTTSLKPAVVTARKLSNSGFLTSCLNDELEQLWLPNTAALSAGEKQYVEFGEESGFNASHKTSGRNPWFGVPGVITPDLMLTVFGELPRLLINDAKLPASNSILIGRFKKPFPTDEFLMLWYSSVTRLGIELAVHSLGGGVLVMVPREADSILMPKPIEKKVSTVLLRQLRKHLEANDMPSAYAVGDKYLTSNGWNSTDVEICKKLAIDFMNRRKK